MPDVPYGFCRCGCGQRTKLAAKTDRRHGHVKGEPVRYLRGHTGRALRQGVIRYAEDPESGCWLWQGSIDAYGYGKLGQNYRYYKAHRVVYELHKGPIPDGLELDHLCRNPPCVNPEHLEPVTHRENMLRSSVNGRNQYRRWTPTEDMLVLAQAITDRALGDLIGRSRGAVGVRRGKLRRQPDKQNPSAGGPS